MTSPRRDPQKPKVLRGEEAAAEGRRMLMEATGTTTIEDAIRVALAEDDEPTVQSTPR